jgi:hypothetical protein
MFDTSIILLIIILLIVSSWLFLSIEKVETDLTVTTSLIPEIFIESYLKPPKKRHELLLNWIQSLFIRLRNLFVHNKKGTIYSPIAVLEMALGWEALPTTVRYVGSSQIPLKVYQGNSHNITLNLYPSTRQFLDNNISVKAQRQGDRVNLTLTTSSKENEFLEIEIIAAGFSVDGDKKQKQLLTADSLKYQWNCFFEKSGTHAFAFVFRVVNTSNVSLQIGRVEQTIKVAQIDHLTQRQVWILATSAGILSGILTLAEILKNLGLW